MVAGASKLSLRDFLLGTVLGMAPGIAVMAALGAQIADLARNASWTNAALLALALLTWIALCLGVQFLVTWMAGRRT
jgi:phospholipase D1/2